MDQNQPTNLILESSNQLNALIDVIAVISKSNVRIKCTFFKYILFKTLTLPRMDENTFIKITLITRFSLRGLAMQVVEVPHFFV